MIEVSWRNRTLSVLGHSGDSRVCASVSLITGTLYLSYGGSPKPESGVFVWTWPPSSATQDLSALDFVLNAFRLLARNYPNELTFHDEN